MIIETLAFDVTGMTERQAYHFVESFRLGIAEYPGLVNHARLRMPNSNRYVIVATWDSEAALAGFRHSDLYARFLLSPHVETIGDRQEGVDQVDYFTELATAA